MCDVKIDYERRYDKRFVKLGEITSKEVALCIYRPDSHVTLERA